MLLTDDHFAFPEDTAPADVIRSIEAVFSNPELKNKGVWLDERMDWANFIYWMADEYWISPIPLLISLQRERSLFGDDGSEKDFDFAQGFVGQHSPGTRNETWNGLPAQLALAARGMAWSFGKRPAESFRRGGIHGKLPQWDRWNWNGPAPEIQLYRNVAPYDVVAKHKAQSAAEHVQLIFTPSENWQDVLERNAEIFQKWIAPFWR